MVAGLEDLKRSREMAREDQVHYSSHQVHNQVSGTDNNGCSLGSANVHLITASAYSYKLPNIPKSHLVTKQEPTFKTYLKPTPQLYSKPFFN